MSVSCPAVHPIRPAAVTTPLISSAPLTEESSGSSAQLSLAQSFPNRPFSISPRGVHAEAWCSPLLSFALVVIQMLSL